MIVDDYEILTNQFESLNFSVFFDSNIVSFDQSNKLIEVCEFNNDKKFKLIYRASRDGFSADSFHSNCNFIPKTLTLIKVKDKPHIFGGYTEVTWDGNGLFKEDSNAFIFSFVNDYSRPFKLKINEKYKAVYCCIHFGPIFGLTEFQISSYSNTNMISFSNLRGATYQNQNYRFNSYEARNLLAGSYNFCTSEIEVFQVI